MPDFMVDTAVDEALGSGGHGEQCRAGLQGVDGCFPCFEPRGTRIDGAPGPQVQQGRTEHEVDLAGMAFDLSLDDDVVQFVIVQRVLQLSCESLGRLRAPSSVVTLLFASITT
ncbi:hypothetical protein [Streptomyces sp. LaBMicrA B280]|uniref:hypothetical protein n=1 Tax=Streptomyces sp. LaBMicrA B280 TaxID=3391001 RepID=UPI003BA5F56B